MYFSTTLPWSSTKEEPPSTINLHKTRSSPSIFAMSNKSSVLYFNNELRESRDSIIEERPAVLDRQVYPEPVVDQGSPGELKKSQTLNYACDWKKSSTMPHKHIK